MDKCLSVFETAKQRGVTPMAVRYWIKKGLKHSKERVIGKKEYIVINPKDVDTFLNLTKRD
jgi:DNA-binding transcriptional MerR regulator